MNRKRKAHGSSLIEVMVALFVLAIGLLGFAGLQTEGITMGRQAYMNSQAAFLAQDMVERMVANLAEARSAGYDLNYGQTVTAPNPNCNAGTTTCSPSQMADYDRNQWLTNVSNALPAGEASIVTVSNGPSFTVTVNLRYQLAYGRLTADEQAGNQTPPQTYTYTMVTEL